MTAERQSSSQSDGPLAPLLVFDSLEVAAPRLETNRVVTPYRLRYGDAVDTVDLIFRYSEPVFDPADPASQNLASMMGAQVALNYGLFCRTIRFEGVFDRWDRRLLREAAENTAREIYVKKFLEPNVFLLDAFRELTSHRLRSYLQARLEFPRESDTLVSESWNTSSRRFSVLSSGGKDSLLTFGLMRELGFEIHPVFGNESGRHWFTALNAFRYFSQHIPETTRVWINSDRVFSWMLRHFPFIRKDFSQIRSDEYPIRLWTVAVFLFGALPILRKRGVGRLLIGDEFDTTHRTSKGGITHYDGLYDQSRYFDNFMTRYFRRKSWNLEQFSVLRPLSELLIQKTLAQRYPELQAQQVSCHAAHKEADRVRPCGRCEKCRRIVAMLLSVGCDPTHSGYSGADGRRCLERFVSEGVHQEKAAAQHLAWLLTERRLITLPRDSRKKARPHLEVMSLRFDTEHAPLDGIPAELRKGLYEILLQHADGAVMRQGRTWTAIDLLSHPSLNAPYPFSRSGNGHFSGGTIDEAPYLLATLTWPEAAQRFAEVDVALLPVGAIEQHGPHLPLDTDSFDAECLALEVARGCSDPKPLVFPLVPYGVSYHHEDFAGTISLSNDTLTQLIYEIGLGATRNGITKLVIINGHGGNEPALNYAAQMINRDAHIFVCVDSGETSDPDINDLVETPNDVHAGEIETSTSLATRPHLVQMSKAEKFIPRFSSRYLNFTSKRSVSWYAYTRRISKSGVMGDPTQASAEKGKRIWELMIRHLISLVEDLKGLSLDEIFQRRY